MIINATSHAVQMDPVLQDWHVMNQMYVYCRLYVVLMALVLMAVYAVKQIIDATPLAVPVAHARVDWPAIQILTAANR